MTWNMLLASVTISAFCWRGGEGNRGRHTTVVKRQQGRQGMTVASRPNSRDSAMQSSKCNHPSFQPSSASHFATPTHPPTHTPTQAIPGPPTSSFVRSLTNLAGVPPHSWPEGIRRPGGSTLPGASTAGTGGGSGGIKRCTGWHGAGTAQPACLAQAPPWCTHADS